MDYYNRQNKKIFDKLIKNIENLIQKKFPGKAFNVKNWKSKFMGVTGPNWLCLGRILIWDFNWLKETTFLIMC